MTPPGPEGPTVPVIHDLNPVPTLDRLVTYVATPNLTAVGANAFFTTEANRGRFFPVDIWVCPIVNTGTTATPTFRIGYTNSGTVYSDWVSGQTFLSSLLLNQYFEAPLKADAGGTAPTGRYSAPPSTPVVIYVATAGAAPCAATFVMRGFYV